ncbi:MAG: hypothetical protein OXQ94_18480 [Gemmatimonadota bacterium]|nr:hypothetical protein [Gemmatimonadota bacterium]MDE2873661.1 hypothetical protein [Gemmatimonadota bacterium]
MRAARALRTSGLSDGDSTTYQARAEGHIYFYLEREDGGDPVPMRVDQVAVDLYRSRDGRTRQIVRGLRRQELLPVKDFRYYVDRLTAVQNGFGNRISIGQGYDVRGVPHPLGSDGGTLYRYRIVDSVRVTVRNMPTPIRVYEVEVRPRREDVPAFVGSVFLEATTGALVRMVFSFTPASYVDRRNDRVHVRLEHILWEERWWLPYRQVVEVRREMPEFDLPVRTVIRATLQVIDYDFEPDLPPGFFSGPPIVLARYDAADSSEFREGLMDRMAEEGLSPVSLAGIEAEARRIAREQVVSGLPRTRLYADGSSSLLRANRAEGVYTGLGVSFAPRPAVRLTAMAGYGFASRKPSATVRGRWTVDDAAAATTVELFGLQLRDVGPRPGASGALNTLSTLLRNLDYTDPYFATGGRAALDYRVSDDGARIRVTSAWEDFSGLSDPWSGGLGATDRSRPLRPVEEGVFMSAGGGFTYSWGSLPTWGAEVALNTTAGRWHGRGNATVTARVDVDIATRDLGRRGSLAMEAGLARGTLPHQLSFFLGGRGTLPGHPYRAYGGRRFLLAGGEASFTVLPTWLTARLLGGAGAVGDTPSALADDWAASSTSGWRGYAGAGLAALHDILRIDGVWGLPGGVFELVFSVDPRLSPFL